MSRLASLIKPLTFHSRSYFAEMAVYAAEFAAYTAA